MQLFSFRQRPFREDKDFYKKIKKQKVFRKKRSYLKTLKTRFILQGFDGTLIRKAHNKENPYALISRNTIQDKNLSLKAKGLFSLPAFPAWRLANQHNRFNKALTRRQKISTNRNSRTHKSTSTLTVSLLGKKRGTLKTGNI